MLKKLPSRNHRNKGIRVKHILQIALLLGVCFWLLYQLKHSHDKKVALDEEAAKASIRSLSEGELLKLGRKDLPHKDISKTVKQEEEEEEETVGVEDEKHEVEGLEEDQKQEADEREDEDPKDEQEEEENKNEDMEEEGGAGDDEIDENEQERKEGKTDHQEDIVDEEKEREDEGDEKGEMEVDRNENEEREGRAENENSSDDQDNNGGDKNAHEAQEEHYKGDDASSAVTHDAQVISTETEKVSSETANENSTSRTLEKEVKSNYLEDRNETENSLRLLVGSPAENDTVSVPASEEKINENFPKAVNATMKLQSDDIPEAYKNSTIVSTKASNNTQEVNQVNGTETLSMLGHSQNTTLDGMTTREGTAGETMVVEHTNSTTSANYSSDTNSTVPNDKVQSNVFENILRYNGSAQAEDASRFLTITESTDATKNGELKNEDANMNENEDANKNKDSNGTSESSRFGDKSDSRNGTAGAVQQEPIDSSDSFVSEDKKEAHTDLVSSAEMKIDGNENGQAAVE